MSYVAMEILEGANQYKCESCNKHVNAIKVCFKNQHTNHHKLQCIKDPYLVFSPSCQPAKFYLPVQ